MTETSQVVTLSDFLGLQKVFNVIEKIFAKWSTNQDWSDIRLPGQ